MFEQHLSPSPADAHVHVPAVAHADDVELSDAELEHVVGGLARVWHEALPALAADARALGGYDALAF